MKKPHAETMRDVIVNTERVYSASCGYRATDEQPFAPAGGRNKPVVVGKLSLMFMVAPLGDNSRAHRARAKVTAIARTKMSLIMIVFVLCVAGTSSSRAP